MRNLLMRVADPFPRWLDPLPEFRKKNHAWASIEPVIRPDSGAPCGVHGPTEV